MGPRWRPASARNTNASAGAIHLFLRALPRGPRSLRRGSQNLAGFLRETILTALYTGHLAPGDRLPSIRELASVLGVAKRDVEAAYALLHRWGITAPRDRSGMYVATLSPPQEPPGSETATWVAQVLDGACEHQVRIPYLPELLRRWTTGEHLRCACIESDRDSLETLRAEIERNFGVTAVPVDITELPDPETDPTGPNFTGLLSDTHLWVTSPLFAPVVRPWADRLQKPLVLATLQPRIVAAIEEHLAHSRLLVVCTDPRYGERIRSLFGRGAGTFGIDVVLASDVERVAAIPPTEPVLLTWPAREALKQSNLRLLAPVSPAYGEDFARNLVRLLLRFNLAPR